jgi:hypothetical protein
VEWYHERGMRSQAESGEAEERPAGGAVSFEGLLFRRRTSIEGMYRGGEGSVVKRERVVEEKGRTMRTASVEKYLRDFRGVGRDFDDVAVSATGAAASERAFATHGVAALLIKVWILMAEAVGCDFEAIGMCKCT